MTTVAGASGRRVLLVEDDASIARFVEMALEDLGLELTVCVDVESALAALHEGPVQLIITDLMLPGLSGFDLVDRLHAEPVLLAGAKLVIFSAGIGAASQERLESLGIWRVLRKPASVAQLLACVDEAFADAADACAVEASGRQQEAAPEPSDSDAIAAYFGGDTALFQAYRAKCLVQFASDLAVGDAALRTADLPALQRLAHSLSTVFCTLGWTHDGRTAKALEGLAAAGDVQASAIAWSSLRVRLLEGTPT